MNLFIIPSWYPSSAQPLAGIFTREQAESIAELSPDINVFISLWGQGDGEIKLKSPGQTIKAINWLLHNGGGKVVSRNNFHELFSPAISWSYHKICNSHRIVLQANRKNLLAAEKQFGKMDLIHAHVSYPAGFIAAQLSQEKGIPYILTEHMSPFPFPTMLHNGTLVPELSTAFQRSASVVAVSRSLAKQIESFGLPESVVIPNMVDERCFYPSERSEGKIVFLTLCGITEQKGIDVLLEAIAHWNPSPDIFEFRIAGDGPMLTAYQQKAEKLGLAGIVKWEGAVLRENVPQLFRDCSIFVLPSRHETFGVVYAEALASGRPVIATRCGGPEDIVNDGNGRLVSVENPIELASTMEWMANHLDLFNSASIRQDFERSFSRAAVVGKLRNLYFSLLGGASCAA